jgi:hypothetical protein
MRLKVKGFLENLVIIYYKVQGYKIIHFLHIGKTGGTAIKSALLESDKIILNKIIIHERYVFVLHKHNFHLDKVKDGESAFFSVRDPIERFISGFYSRMRRGQLENYDKWLPFEEDSFKIFKHPNQLAEALTNSRKEVREDAERAMQSILHVRKSMWEWFIDEEFLSVNRSKIIYILRQEALDSDFITFQEALGIKLGALPTDSIKAHKMPLYQDKKLSQLAVMNLKNWYRKDYQFIDWLVKENLLVQIKMY